MSVTLYDSDNPDAIPSGVFAAGYCDGYAAPAWTERGWSRFPNARRIAVSSATNDGDVGDVENGDMLPWELPDWIVMRRNAGVADPWGYVNLSNWGPTRTEFQLRGIPEPHWWVADYDGVAEVPAGAVAKQYADPAIIPGNPHYDLSVVLEAFGPGGGTIGGDMAQPEVYRNPIDGSEWELGGHPPWNPSWKVGVDAERAKTLDMIAKLQGFAGLRIIDNANVMLDRLPIGPPASGGTEPPEPAEPKTITLTIPSVPGTATGTIG